MDKGQDLCDSLIKWLNTFDLEAHHRTVEEISDGVAMAQTLTQIAPEWFDKSFMSKIKRDVDLGWRLKVSNLKKIVEHIFDYYQECLNQQLSFFGKPDVAKIAEHRDRTELGRLLQLILGCAVNCAKKEAYITVIMGMEESVQRVIMQAIQELDSGSQISLGPVEDNHLHRISVDLDRVIEERDQMAQRCHELDMQVSLLQDEKTSLAQEVSKLQSRLTEAESPASVAVSSSKYGLLRREFDTLKEEMYKVESARDDSRARLEIQDRLLSELQARNDELQIAADEARLLKDEMDILRETADKVAKYEATVESYKRKLEELSDLKRQYKLLEDKNAHQLQNNLELEEELKRQGTWKSQAEIYKKQIGELHQRISDETKKADKFAFDNNKLMEKSSALTREKERLIAERDLLREANDELTCQVGARSAGDTADELQPELREKLARLTQENRRLQLLQKEAEQLPVVQAMLDAANTQIQTVTADSRSANQRILELESQLEEIHLRNQETGDEEVSSLRKEKVMLQKQIRDLSIEMEQLKLKGEQQEEQIDDLSRGNVQLKEALQRKETELAAQEEKTKKCVEKAKIVVSSLEPKQHELTALRNQLLEKDGELQRLEQERGLLTEVRLMSKTFHRLSAKRQRESADQRLSALSAGATFLARQRTPVPRKLPSK